MAVLAESAGQARVPVLLPGAAQDRLALRRLQAAHLRDPDATGKKHKAYRLVLNAGTFSEYYGVQGMAWKDPPILDDPDRTRTVDGRKLQLYYDGSTCGSSPGRRRRRSTGSRTR